MCLRAWLCREVIRAAYILDLCGRQPTEAGCQATLVNSSSVCQWRTDNSTNSLAFLASPTTRCLPSAPVMETYLSLTAPSACPEDATMGVCITDFKCRYEDHIEHAHCLVDFNYIQRALGGGTLAIAANRAQHLCSPETIWPTFEISRPLPLNRSECEQREVFELPQGLLARLATAAEVGTVQAPSQSLCHILRWLCNLHSVHEPEHTSHCWHLLGRQLY